MSTSHGYVDCPQCGFGSPDAGRPRLQPQDNPRQQISRRPHPGNPATKNEVFCSDTTDAERIGSGAAELHSTLGAEP